MYILSNYDISQALLIFNQAISQKKVRCKNNSFDKSLKNLFSKVYKYNITIKKTMKKYITILK